MDLFDKGKSEYARDEAIDRVDRNANKAWKQFAQDAFVKAAEDNYHFTADHVWQLIPDEAPQVHDGRAMGAVMKWAVKKGLCVAEGFSSTTKVSGHGHPFRLWRSLIQIRWEDNDV